MSNFLYQPKIEADQLMKVEIWWLNKNGYLVGYKSGTIGWKATWNTNAQSISVTCCIDEDLFEQSFIRFNYTTTHHYTGEKHDYDYRLDLVSSKCNFGGIRYWFICSGLNNGGECNRRVGVVYKFNDRFACRHCYKLTYSSRNINSRSRFYPERKSWNDYENAYELYQTIRRFYYRGKPTRKFRRVRTLAIRSGYAASLIRDGVI